jgi:hypothetical protein
MAYYDYIELYNYIYICIYTLYSVRLIMLYHVISTILMGFMGIILSKYLKTISIISTISVSRFWTQPVTYRETMDATCIAWVSGWGSRLPDGNQQVGSRWGLWWGYHRYHQWNSGGWVMLSLILWIDVENSRKDRIQSIAYARITRLIIHVQIFSAASQFSPS